MRAFEASLAREGLNFKDVSTGAYLNNAGTEPGKPCLTLETLHLAIARLAEGTRRKIYAGMFFLGRERQVTRGCGRKTLGIIDVDAPPSSG